MIAKALPPVKLLYEILVTGIIRIWLKKASLLPIALMAMLVVAVFLPAMMPSAFARSCGPEISITLSSGGIPVKEVRAGVPVVVAAEHDGLCSPRSYRWVIEIRNSDGFVEHTQWQSSLQIESSPYGVTP